MTSHYHASQLQYSYLKMKVNFHHWWNSSGAGNDPTKNPSILTRRLKNLPLVSLRNSEFAAYLVKLGIDKEHLPRAGIPMGHALGAKRAANGRVQDGYLYFGAGEAEESFERPDLNQNERQRQMPRAKQKKKTRPKKANTYHINVVEKLNTTIDDYIDPDVLTPSSGRNFDTFVTNRLQGLRSPDNWKIHEIEDTRTAENQRELEQDEEEEDEEEQEQEEEKENNAGEQAFYPKPPPLNERIREYNNQPVRRESGFSRFFPFKSKKMKFIRSPPLKDESENINENRDEQMFLDLGRQQEMPEPGARRNRFSLVTPALGGAGHAADILLDRPTRQRVMSDITSTSTTVFRPLKVIMKRELSTRMRRPESTGSQGPGLSLRVSSERSSYVPPRRTTTQNRELFTTIINDVSLSAARQANGLGRTKIRRPVNSGFTNINDYSNLMNNENKAFGHKRPESNHSLDTCINQTIMIEAKPEQSNVDSAPLALVLESSTPQVDEEEYENYGQSTIGYGMDIIANYQYSDGVLTKRERDGKRTESQSNKVIVNDSLFSRVDIVRGRDPSIRLRNIDG